MCDKGVRYLILKGAEPAFFWVIFFWNKILPSNLQGMVFLLIHLWTFREDNYLSLGDCPMHCRRLIASCPYPLDASNHPHSVFANQKCLKHGQFSQGGYHPQLRRTNLTKQ